MENIDGKLKLVEGSPAAFEEKSIRKLLADVDSLTHTDLVLMAACDELAGTCRNFMGIHVHVNTPGCSSMSHTASANSNKDKTSQHSLWEYGEGCFSNQLSFDTTRAKIKCQRHTVKDGQQTTNSHSSLGYIKMASSAEYKWPPRPQNDTMSKLHKEKKGKVHLQGKPPLNENDSFQKPLLTETLAQNEESYIYEGSCVRTHENKQSENGFLERLDTSRELTLRLNDSLAVFRHELDRLFDTPLSVSHKKDNMVDASVHCDLGIEDLEETGIAKTISTGHLNLSDQGYSSDLNTLEDSPSECCLVGLSSIDTTKIPNTPCMETSFTPISPSEERIPSSAAFPPGYSALHSPRRYPEGIVKNPFSPRSAFKKVVRFS